MALVKQGGTDDQQHGADDDRQDDVVDVFRGIAEYVADSVEEVQESDDEEENAAGSLFRNGGEVGVMQDRVNNENGEG